MPTTKHARTQAIEAYKKVGERMSRLTCDTPVSELYHSEEDELTHWGIKKGESRKDHKYLKREWKNGRWRYYYDLDELKDNINAKKSEIKSNINTKKNNLKSNVKDTATKTAEKTLKKTTDTVNKNANNLVNLGKNIINKLYTDPDNVYYMNKSNYSEKMAKVKETQEWKDIVARNDSEYVQKNADGTTTYLIDDYVVKKKHPVLDIASDIAAGRKVDINEITKESTVAAIRDYSVATVNMGMLVAGVASKALTEKFKFQQGTYADDIQQLTSTVNQGVEYTKAITESAPTVSKGAVEQTADMIKAAQTVASKSNVTDAVKSINEGNVIKAAQVLMESESMQNTIGSNEYYKLAESALSNMSEEEMAALSLLLRQMYSK